MVNGKRMLFLALSLVVVFIGSLVAPAVTYAKSMQSRVPQSPQLGTYSSPPWWNGQTCDKGHYQQAYLITTWRGIQVCGPLPGATSSHIDAFSANGKGADQYEFMCTDLVARYMLAAYGVPSQIANGWQVVDKYTSTFPNLFHKVPNDGSIHLAPVEGDVFSYGTNDPGHTSIVTGSSVDANGNGTINVIEQNVEASGTATLTIRNWVVQHDPNHIGTVASWLTTRPLPSTSATINFSFSVQDLSTSPKHTSRIATVKIYNASGSVVETDNQTVSYHSGTFSGSFFTRGLAPGAYTVSVKLSNTLSKMYGGFFTMPTASVNETGAILKLGDVNNDNVLDILDYNDLLSCFGSKYPTCGFPWADLNDDGVVDGIDYNIYLRSVGSQGGGS